MNIGLMTIKMTKKIEPLNFNIETDLISAFTTLRGDIDLVNPYSQYNVCDYTGDTKEHIFECRFDLCRELDIQLNHLIMPCQTHSANVAIIDSAFMQLSDNERIAKLENVDALVCTLKGVAIGVNTADCVPIVFCDVESGIIAVAHAGWKGTVSKIVINTVNEMILLGAKPENIQVAIGASICADCFEVGDEVIAQFCDAGFQIEEIIHRNPTTQKAHINLQRANYLLINQVGIPFHNILISNNCTKCNHRKYFSARTLGISSGRTFTAIIAKTANTIF